MDIQLRNVLDSDLPVFFEHQKDPEANQMAAFPSRDRQSFLGHWAKIQSDQSNILKTIIYDGKVAGNIVSFIMAGKREVGYWLGRQFWGKGIATRALRLFLEDIDTRPLYGVAASHNLGSRRVLEKCGFRVLEENGLEVVLILE